MVERADRGNEVGAGASARVLFYLMVVEFSKNSLILLSTDEGSLRLTPVCAYGFGYGVDSLPDYRKPGCCT